ncbi:unnamed protein product, partial [Ectocarpus sp. 4 AP-2014]
LCLYSYTTSLSQQEQYDLMEARRDSDARRHKNPRVSCSKAWLHPCARYGFHLAYLTLDTDVNRVNRIDLHLCSHRRMLALIASSGRQKARERLGTHYVPNLTTFHHDAACLLFDNICN